MLENATCAIVRTTKGTVNGYRADYGVDSSQKQPYYGSADVFLGIPYAEPPIGPLRFRVSLRDDFYKDRVSLGTIFKRFSDFAKNVHISVFHAETAEN